jgi:predicted nucleic acid-binding protein
MWFESNVMVSTMLELMREHQIPSLSVHDSLIVPARSAEIAQTLLKEKFQSQLGVTPQLKTNWPRQP